jgi:hypothetical protein
MHRSLPQALRPLLLLVLLTATGCRGTRALVDPVVQVRTQGGTELGVTTDYGVVFLGRTARSGPVEITAWFGDGPSVEPSLVEPISPDLCTADVEIELPAVPLLFVDPGPGEFVAVQGRTESGPWREVTTIASDPRVYGLILEMPEALRGRDDQIGAAVFRYIAEDRERLQLYGLVSGSIVIETDEGPKEYATVVGPEQLWRLVTLPRHFPRRKPQVYRDDIL